MTGGNDPTGQEMWFANDPHRDEAKLNADIEAVNKLA